MLIKSYYDYNTVLQRIPRLIAKLAVEEDINYLKNFLYEHEDDVYIKFAGIRALDLIKHDIGEKKTFDLLKPMCEDNEPVIQELAKIMEAEMNSSYIAKNTKEKQMNPIETIKIVDAMLAPTKDTYLYFVMLSWGLLKATEGTDPDIILNITKKFSKCKRIPTPICRWFLTTTKNNPEKIFKMAEFLSNRKHSESRAHGLWILCNVGHCDPQTAIKYIDKIMKRIKENKLTSDDIIFFMCCLTDTKEEFHEKTETVFKDLSTYKDGNVRGFAKILLKWI